LRWRLDHFYENCRVPPTGQQANTTSISSAGEANSYSYSMASDFSLRYALRLDGSGLATGTAPSPPRGLAATSEARSSLPPCRACERNYWLHLLGLRSRLGRTDVTARRPGPHNAAACRTFSIRRCL
jgi:hypothetical protein